MDVSSLVSNFVSVTGSSTEEATFYLESHNWDLDSAISSFYSSSSSSSSSRPPVTPTTPTPTTPTPTPTSAPQTSYKPPQSTTAKKPTGGIKGFSDFKEEASKDDEGNLNWFTGGEKSGLQVQAPKVDKKGLVSDVMKSVQEQGGKNFSDHKSNETFSGSGFMLGNTSGQSQSVGPATPKVTRKKITMWKNGFSVDDGPLRDYNDPNNQAFLKQLQKGELPAEFAREVQGGEIDLEFIDSSGEDYKEPPKVLKPFSGSGQRLGSASSAPVSAPITTTTAPAKIQIDESKPKTSIQIRLADGQRLVGTFNHTHTVRDIKHFIDGGKPPTFSYDLMTSFPQKVLADETQSIQDAGLVNSVVIQKRK